MSSFTNLIKTSPEFAVPRAYLIACCCDIENLSQDIIYSLFNANKCNYLFEFIKRKNFEGELNFKWKNPCFKKFLNLFGENFHNMVMIEVEKELDKNILEDSFETIRANRGSIAHENSTISLTVEEIKVCYENCMKALSITKEYVDNLPS